MSGSTKRKLFEKEKDKGGERASERARERESSQRSEIILPKSEVLISRSRAPLKVF